jgi:uncharacterized SAM-binding protein YcdF (DUF218 family)
MTFILSKVLWALLRPSVLLLLVGLVGLVLARVLSRRRAGLRLITVSLGSYLLILLLPIDQWALMPLEDRFARPDPPPAHVDGIIVLGGVIDSELSDDRGIPSLTSSAERITETVVLARRYPDSKVVFTGGDGDLLPVFPTEADYAKQLLTELGLTDRPIITENRSRNTVENAVFSRALVQPKPGEVWLLVTSASHMPRSVSIFRQAGWPVVPWPVGYKTGHSAKVQFSREFFRKLGQLDWAMHEWVGLAAYRYMGRTDSLFPGPDS